LLEKRVDRTAAADPVSLFETSAALVFDTSVFGSTAPILGSRSRFEVAPTFGTLPLVTVTADYRRYFMPIDPLTIAVRVEHVGRYGPGAADARLLPLVWTLRDLVRGYNPRDLATSACNGPAADPCGGIDDMRAQRLLVTNVEVRMPIVRPSGVSRSLPPIDGLVFADLGAFWTQPSTAGALMGRTALRSIGGGVRVNASGFVFEFVAVHPYDRPGSRWGFAVNFRPGF
jgi:hypothetical protein